MATILVTGALGQIGAELVPALRARHGVDNVIATDLKVLPPSGAAAIAPYGHLDCTEPHQMLEAVRRYDVGTIYHLAALLSAVAEDAPQLAWSINMGGLYNVLEVARGSTAARCSSRARSAPSGRRRRAMRTPQVTIQRPTTMYGVTKVAGELLCDYYAAASASTRAACGCRASSPTSPPPGGGTTDYAVEIFYQALRYGQYTCFLAADTRLDMMYMPDAIARDDRADGSR